MKTALTLIAPAALLALAAPLVAASAPQATPSSLPGTAAAIAEGQALFKQRCAACHSVEPGKPSVLAPDLAGVVGRKAASLAFAYSPALKASGLTWTRDALDAYLAAPSKLVPGTRMVVAVRDPAQRAALIDYLASTGSEIAPPQWGATEPAEADPTPGPHAGH